MEYINKVMICVKTISLKEDGGGGRPTAINLVSAVGIETLNYHTDFQLVGKTEEYLLKILSETIVTIREMMRESYAE
jgi:hypothetical protein